MFIFRKLGAAALAIAAIAVWFLMAPAEPDTQEQVGDRSREITAALSDYSLNEARTQGAPQQTVVNGWVAKDLLAIIAEQQNESVTDERLPALAVLVVFGLALRLATATRPAEAGGAASVSAVPAPDPSPGPSSAV